MKKTIRDNIKDISEDYIGNSTVATLKTGKTNLPFVYHLGWDFKDGKAKVKKDNREYYIDKTGKEIN